MGDGLDEARGQEGEAHGDHRMKPALDLARKQLSYADLVAMAVIRINEAAPQWRVPSPRVLDLSAVPIN